MKKQNFNLCIDNTTDKTVLSLEAAIINQELTNCLCKVKGTTPGHDRITIYEEIARQFYSNYTIPHLKAARFHSHGNFPS